MASTKINIDLALNTKGFRPLGRINGLLGEFEKSLDASNARVLAFGVSAGAILAVKKAFTATVKAAIEVEKSLKDINVILQVTSGNLKKFGSDLFKIASDTGQAFSVAATAATELARQGLGVQETLKRTRDALILARLSGMDAAEAVNSLTAALNTFTKVGLDSTAIINKLANVDAAFAVSSDDLAKALGRVGASAKGAGVSLDQLLAIVTTTQQKTARGGAVIGNSFKTIFTRIQRPRVIKELENLGIAVRDLEGDSLPAIKVLTNLARQFDNLTQSQKAQITELVGGVFQVNILKAAMSDLSKEQSIYNRALDISIGSSDQAIRRNEELNQTLAAQFQKTLNTFKEAAAELGTLTLGPALENIFGSINKTFEAAQGDSGLAKAGQAIAKSVFEGIGKFIGGPGLIIIGAVLFKTFANLATFAADAFKTLTGLNKNFQTQLNLQKQIFNVLSDNPDLMNRIKRGVLTVEDAHDLVLKKINAESTALESQLLISSQIANQLARGGVGFSPEFGATTGGPKEFRGPKQGRRGRRGRSGGYIPNFAGDEELMGMMMGGYSGSQMSNPKIKRSTIHNGSGGAFSAFTNGHEDIVDFMNGRGKKSTAVIPPRGTSAFNDFMGGLSGGFVPNFAKIGVSKLLGLKTLPKTLSKSQLDKIESGVASGKVGTWDTQHPEANAAVAAGKAKRKPGKGKGKKSIPVFDAQQAYGVLSLYGDTNKKSTIFANTSGISKLSGRKGLDPRIAIKNFQQRSFEGAFDAKDSKTINPFAALIKKHFAGPLKSLSNEYFGKELGLGDDKPSAGGLISSMRVGKGQGGALFPKGAEGSIFEAAINAATKNAVGFERSLRGSQNAIWDFEEGGKVNQRLKNGFGFGSRLQRADGKRSVSPEAMTSLANKMFSHAAKFGGPGSRDIKNYIAGKAGGYMPSLHNAIQREKAAGIPAGRIRIGSSTSLASGLNPMGLGVYNTRDEPGGLRQGIRRSLAGGRNPRHAGVPNFATPRDATGQMMKLTMVMVGMNQVTSMLSNSIGDNTTAARQVQSGLSAVEKAMMAMVTVLTIQELIPEKTLNSLNALGGKNIGSLKGIKNFGGPMGQWPGKAWAGLTGGGETFSDKIKGGKYGGSQKFTYQKAGLFTPERTMLQGERIGRGEWMGRKGSTITTGSSKIGGAMKGLGRGLKAAPGAIKGGVMKGAAAMGPLGVAAAGVGAVMLTDKLMNETFNTSFKELGNATKNFESVSQEAEKNIGALTKFGAATEQASKVFYDTNATMGQVMEAQKQLAEFSKELPSNIRRQISGVIDPKQVQAVVERGIVEENKKKGQAQQRLDVAKNNREIRQGWFDLTGGSFKSEKELERESRQTLQVTDRITGGISDEKLAGLSATDMESLTKTLKTADSFGGAFDWGGNLGQVEAELLNLFDRSTVDDFIKAMEEGDHSATVWSDSILQSVLDNRRRVQEDRATAGVRKELIKQTRDAARAVKEQKDIIELEQKIRKETIKISEQAAGAFLTASGKIGLQGQTKLAGLQEVSARKFGDVISQTSKAFGSTQLGNTGLGQSVMGTISGAARGGAGSVNQRAVAAQVQQLKTLAESTKDDTEKKMLQQMATQLETLGATAKNQFKELQRQTYETRRIVQAQKQAAAQAVRLKSFGGGQGLLDPKSLNSVINQITGAEKSMGINARAGSRTGFNRANANRFAGMQTLLGGELPPAMREKAMRAATQVKVADISLMNKRFGLGLSGRDIKQRASEQAGELFKGEPLDRNNKNLESLNRTLFENNALLAAAQNSRVYLGSIEAQNARQSSTGYQWFKQNQGTMTAGASREHAGWQGYAASIQQSRAEESGWNYNHLQGPGGNIRRIQNAYQQESTFKQGAMRMATNNATNTATTVNMYMNGLQMQGNQAMNQRAMNFIGYLSQFNPQAARAASMAQIPIGR